MADRHRGFNAVFYPESAPEDFREVIAGWNVPALMILHDEDEGKKPHYHLLLTFGSLKTIVQVKNLVVELGSSMVQPAYDIRGSARYLAHLDQPTKHRYPIEAIEAFSGASVPDLVAPVIDPTPEILDFVADQGLTEYSTLVDYCHHERSEWLKEVKGHSIFWGYYFTSVRHKGERNA